MLSNVHPFSIIPFICTPQGRKSTSLIPKNALPRSNSDLFISSFQKSHFLKKHHFSPAGGLRADEFGFGLLSRRAKGVVGQSGGRCCGGGIQPVPPPPRESFRTAAEERKTYSTIVPVAEFPGLPRVRRGKCLGLLDCESVMFCPCLQSYV